MDFKSLFFNMVVIFAAVECFTLRHQSRSPRQRLTWRRRLSSARPTSKPYTWNGSNGSPKISTTNNKNGAPSISHSVNINNLNLKPGQSKVIRQTLVISHKPVGTSKTSPRGQSNQSGTSNTQTPHNPFHNNRNQGHPNNGNGHNNGNSAHGAVPNGRSGSGHGHFETLRLPIVNIDNRGNVLSVNSPNSHNIGVLVKGGAGARPNRHNNGLGRNSQAGLSGVLGSANGGHGGAGQGLGSANGGHGAAGHGVGSSAAGVNAVDIMVADSIPGGYPREVNGANNGLRGADGLHANVGIRTSGVLNSNMGVHLSGTPIPSIVEVVSMPMTAGGAVHTSTGQGNGQRYYEMHLSNGQRVLYAVKDKNINNTKSKGKSAGKSQGGSGSKASNTKGLQTTEEPPENATGPGGIEAEDMVV